MLRRCALPIERCINDRPDASERHKEHSLNSADRENQVGKVDTTIVRALAVLLVTNSHLEAFYPRSFLADGGLIGLALFFAASGFGLALSSRTRTMAFPGWMWRRAKRIYPALWLAVIAMGLIANGQWKSWQFQDYVAQFVYPTQYHFIAKILVFYVAIYWCLRLPSRGQVYGVPILLTAGLIFSAWGDMVRLYHEPIPLQTGKLAPLFLWLVFFAITWIATMLGIWKEKSGLSTPGETVTQERMATQAIVSRDWLALATLFAGYLASKFVTAKLGVAPWLFPVYFAISIAFSLHLFYLASHPQIVKTVQKRRWLWKPIAFLSAISLEVYLVHSQMVHWPQWQSIGFPLNMGVFFFCSVAVAWGIHQLARRLL